MNKESLRAMFVQGIRQKEVLCFLGCAVDRATVTVGIMHVSPREKPKVICCYQEVKWVTYVKYTKQKDEAICLLSIRNE